MKAKTINKRRFKFTQAVMFVIDAPHRAFKFACIDELEFYVTMDKNTFILIIVLTRKFLQHLLVCQKILY